MTSERVYLDWNATAPLRPEAQAAMAAAFEHPGNASSVHAEGRRARHLVEEARAAIAALLGAGSAAVLFTSGGTEGNVTALSPGLGGGEAAGGCDCLLVSAAEHVSVLSGGRFAPEHVETIRVDPDGQVDLEDLSALLSRAQARGRRALVSIMAANNETGVIQPVEEVAKVVHGAGGLLHVDAVQAAGRMTVDFAGWDADLITVSAHKMGGPQGVGALVYREGLHVPALLRGGGQERGRRAGTENAPAIAGFGAAARTAMNARAAEQGRLERLRRQLEEGLRRVSAETVIFGEAVARVSNTTLFAVPGVKAETALIALDLDGIAVSSGSACSSGKVAPSHVLAAMGVDAALAAGAIRVSLGYRTSENDVERFLEGWRKHVESIGRRQKIAA